MAGRGYTFTASVEKDKDGRWNAWLNEIPWCITFGDTQEEAMRELQDAACAVVEHLKATGQKIPEHALDNSPQQLLVAV